MKSCSKVFMNHMNKIGQICCMIFQVKLKIISLFLSERMLKKVLTQKARRKEIFLFFLMYLYCLFFVFTLWLHTLFKHVYLEWFIYIKTSSCYILNVQVVLLKCHQRSCDNYVIGEKPAKGFVCQGLCPWNLAVMATSYYLLYSHFRTTYSTPKFQVLDKILDFPLVTYAF